MQNFFLEQLSPHDQALLRRHLTKVNFDARHALFDAGEHVKHVYLPVRAVISLVITLSTGETIECAMVGRDGLVGASAALDGRLSLSRGVVQLPGEILVCDLDAFKSAALKSQTLLEKIHRHEQMIYAQAQQSAACLAVHPVQARLCRWLLRARDLSGSDTLPFTQEYLAEMLGVRRTSVTVEAHQLQTAGCIRYARGRIQILNAEALQDSACECYETINGHYAHLFGEPKG